MYTLEPPNRGGSNVYPQCMFWSKNKNLYTPVNPSFTILKWGLRGCSLHGHVFVMSRAYGYFSRYIDEKGNSSEKKLFF